MKYWKKICEFKKNNNSKSSEGNKSL